MVWSEDRTCRFSTIAYVLSEGLWPYDNIDTWFAVRKNELYVLNKMVSTGKPDLIF